MKLFLIIFSFVMVYANNFNLNKNFLRYLNKKPKKLLRNYYFKAYTDKKIVALTFDDGPSLKSYKLTRFLKEKKVNATFFLIAKNLNFKNANFYKNKLFEVGIHSYSHKFYNKLSYKEILQDIKKAKNRFFRVKLYTNYFRTPYGIINYKSFLAISKNGLKNIFWSIDSKDYLGLKGKKYINNIINSITPGSIILMHEQKTSIDDLSVLIDLLRQKGYKFVKISKILKYKNILP
jgi:peptidoglycan/xylan/chitin deacetylase (PgdA/CDA1 family)